MKTKLKAFGIVSLICITALGAKATTVSFTAQDVIDAMSAAGTPLHDSTYQWGIWAVRVMPVVAGGYTLVSSSGSTTQTGWGTSVPNGAFGASPYTAANSAWFYDYSGAPTYAANPLYMIMDQPASSFTSYFGNTVTAVGDSSVFSFSFDLDAGATWNGQIQFVVDGSQYSLGDSTNPGDWIEDYFGGYGDSGGLTGNSGNGYSLSLAVPDSGSTMLLLGLSFLTLAVFGLKQNRLQEAK